MACFLFFFFSLVFFGLFFSSVWLWGFFPCPVSMWKLMPLQSKKNFHGAPGLKSENGDLVASI